MKIRIIAASAGSGKTTRLSEVLDEAIASGKVRADGIVATTFTRQAAAELIERARSRLLASGRGREAHQLLAARIGTVNSVCGSLVTDFAFELGLSPSLRVLDESSAELEQNRALASIVDPALADELYEFRNRFDSELDWRQEVRKLIEAGRANGLDPTQLAACADRSIETLEACLGPRAADGDAIDRTLIDAIDDAVANIDTSIDETDVTRKYLDLLGDARRRLSGRRLRWGDWAKLSRAAPGAKSAAAAGPVSTAALQHAVHPRLRSDMHRLIRLLFQVAADGLTAYQAHKRERGVIDFVDQEALALRLLRRADVRAALEGQLDLVLIDEFQDTSPLQLAIFLELASLARESVWVGDQKQAIYGFRGTDPALMDAVIESLTATTTDPELIRTAVEAVGHSGSIETLSTSYRSRPELVHLTSEIFARAFAHQGIPQDRTRLTPSLTSEPAGLGPIIEYWPLVFPKRMNKNVLAGAAAAGVRDLLNRRPDVRDRNTGTPRVAGRRDVAVLCRTNEQCQLIAEALAELDIPAVVPRTRILDTAEGQLVMAGLRLWVDPRDALAAAQLARLVSYATDLQGLVTRALAVPGSAAFVDDPVVAAILAARGAAPDLDPVAALAAVIDASGLRELCAAWGNIAQRHANLDALRAYAVVYVDEATASRDVASLVGLLGYFDDTTDDWGWNAARTDRQALLGGADAVTVSTWHAAKGREWPLTVLFGLETLREPTAHGLHIESDATGFDLEEPLAGRWLRYWPNPYTTSNQRGLIKDAYEQSGEFAAVVARREREMLRLLYVGWTRARDRLVLAAAAGNFTAGLLGILTKLDPGLISEPANDELADVDVSWAERDVRVSVRPVTAAAAVSRATEPGEINVGRGLQSYPLARLSPSTAPPLPCTLGEPITLGSRLSVRGDPDMEMIGHAVHDFLAADRTDLDEGARLELALDLLRRYCVDAHLDAADVVEASARLLAWIERDFAATRLHREWPVVERLDTGTLVAGTADLVVQSSVGFALIDHKTFPGTLAAALERLPKYSGQLAAYAQAITEATRQPVTSMWIHLPILSVAVELRLVPST